MGSRRLTFYRFHHNSTVPYRYSRPCTVLERVTNGSAVPFDLHLMIARSNPEIFIVTRAVELEAWTSTQYKERCHRAETKAMVIH